MAEIELYISVLLKFLAASVLLERILELAEKTYSLLGVGLGQRAQLLRLAEIDLTREEESHRLLTKAFVMQSIGIVLGIVICYFSGLGILRELKLVPGPFPNGWDLFLSGILISGGSEPIHQLINLLNGHKDQLKVQRSVLREKVKTSAPVAQTPPGQKIGITYRGGLYPGKPGHGLRKSNPQYIVIHHSGTSSNATFEDIVKQEQKERKNAKGSYHLDPSFHSVITADGAYHHYCRWDAVGWHVGRSRKVSNANSLGLCFVGNFQNRRGKAQKPTEAQIESGAKLVALWRILYNIPEKNILAHSAVQAGRRCPGENFPMERLVAKANQYLKQWKSDPEILEEIDRFKKQRYVYV